MSRVKRGTRAGSVYLDLQKLARRDRRPTDELIDFYTLECFLDRLTRSGYSQQFVLKGGVLLAAFGERRPTRDIDLQASTIAAEAANVLLAIRTIAELELDDGLRFHAAGATAEPIRDEGPYTGFRVSMLASLATANSHFHVDVNFGDPITPAPQQIRIPRLLTGEISLRGHPLSMVYAEKIVTAITRGTANTRWRDFADIYLLTRSQPVEADELANSIRSVAGHRAVELLTLSESLFGYADIAQRKWQAWRRRQKLEDRLPENFADLLDAATAFADPVLSGKASGLRWRPTGGKWEPSHS